MNGCKGEDYYDLAVSVKVHDNNFGADFDRSLDELLKRFGLVRVAKCRNGDLWYEKEK